MSTKQLYRFTAKAGPWVAGYRRDPASATISLTPEEAELDLLAGTIVPDGTSVTPVTPAGAILAIDRILALRGGRDRDFTVAELAAFLAASDLGDAVRSTVLGTVAPDRNTLAKVSTALDEAVAYWRAAIQTRAPGGVVDDLASLARRVAGQEVLDVGPRLNLVEGAVGAPNTLRVRTVAEAMQATIPASVERIETVGHTYPGIGGATYVRSGTPGPGAGMFPAGGAWWIVEAASLRLEDLGAGIGNLSADAAAITGAKRFGSIARLGRTISGAGVTDLSTCYDLTFLDDGSGQGQLVDLPGKVVTPPLVRDAAMTHAGDYIAPVHARRSIECTAVVEGIIGDSTGTNSADLSWRSNTLASALMEETRAQCPRSKSYRFVNYSIGGKTFGDFFDTDPNRPFRPLWWAVGDTRAWIDQFLDQGLTRAWLNSGANDGDRISILSMKRIRDYIRSRSDCDIGWITCLLPRPTVVAGNPQWLTIADQEAKMEAAGLVRRFAKYYGDGLIDANRQMVRAVHGYDPVVMSLVRSQTGAVSGNGFAGIKKALGYKVHFTLDTAVFPVNSVLGFPTGPGSVDAVYITRLSDTEYGVSLYAGDGADFLAYSLGTRFTLVPNDGSRVALNFEMVGDSARFYRDGTGAEEYGANLPDYWRSPIISRGGPYLPMVTCSVAGAIVGGLFDYAEPAKCRPSTSLARVFGTGVFSSRGGIFNHPSSAIDDEVHRPLLKGIAFYGADPFDRLGPTTMKVKAATGVIGRYLFDGSGFATLDGPIASATLVRAPGGFYGGAGTDTAPRIVKAGGAWVFTTGAPTDAGYTQIDPDGTLTTVTGGIVSAGVIRPGYDNLVSLGTASARFKEVFAVTGAVSSSDARYKLDRDGAPLLDERASPLTDAEIAWGCDLIDEIGAYVWRDAYAEKRARGEAARLHVGTTVQRAIALAARHGVDPYRWGLVCLNRWDAEPAREAEYGEVQTGCDEAGGPIMTRKEILPARPGREAGEILSFRVDELLLLMTAAQGWRQSRLEVRLAALEGRFNAPN